MGATMKASTQTAAEREQEKRIVLMVVPLFFAFSAAIVGTILVIMLGGYIEMYFGWHPPWWTGTLGGMVVGLISGLISVVRDYQRTDELASQASSLSLQPLAEKSAERVTRRLKNLIVYESHLSNAHFSSVDGMHFVVGDLSIDKNSPGSRPESESRNTLQTVACVEFEDFEFPQFEVQPEGFGTKVVELLSGEKDIDFVDSPEFSRQFYLRSSNRARVQMLFSIEVRNLLETTPGLTIIGKESQLLIYRQNKLCKSNDLADFVETALKIIDVLQQSSLKIATKPKAAERNLGQSIVAPQNGPETSSKITITNDPVSRFVQQSTPRNIPRQLLQQFQADWFFLIFGGVICLFGFVALGFGLFDDLELFVRAIMVAGGCLGLLIGIFILVFTKYLERKRLNTLRNGQILMGQITAVTESSVVSGNQRVHDVVFQSTDGSALKSKVKGRAANKAFDLMEKSQSVHAVQNPEHLNQCVVINCYTDR